MTTLVDKLVEKLNELPRRKRNERVREMLEDLDNDGDEVWERLFADPRSEKVLRQMAAEAIKEHEAGKTKPLEASDFLKTGV